MTDKPTIFADGLLEAAVHHGVARLTLGQIGVDGKPAPCGILAVPVLQLPALANGILGLLKQVEARMKEAQVPQPGAPAAPAPEEAMPATFTFGGR
jgi:hypothetical protein